MRWQIIAKNPDRAAGFYCDLFGWTVSADNALGYRQFDTHSPAGIPGGLWPAPPDGHAMVQLFVAVDDVSATVAKAGALGVATIIPPQKLPDGDEMAVILDPEGLPLGLCRLKARA